MSVLFAHFSDTHLVAPFTHGGWRMNRKQWLALLNWWWRRCWHHRRDLLKKAVQQIITAQAEFVIITGDLTQIGRSSDYAFFYEMVRPLQDAKIPVLLMAGNHDWYADNEKMRTDFKQLRLELSLHLAWHGEPLRFKQLDIFPVDGACVTPDFQAWGEISLAETMQLFTAWHKLTEHHPQQIRLACGHFPMRSHSGKILPPALVLRGSETIFQFLQDEKFSAYLCGHIHKSFHLTLNHRLTQFCAGSLTMGGALQFFTADDESVKLL